LVATASSWNGYRAGGYGSEARAAAREARLEDAAENDEVARRWALPVAAAAPEGAPEVDVNGEELDTSAAPAAAGRRLAEEEEPREEGARCCDGNASELDLDLHIARSRGLRSCVRSRESIPAKSKARFCGWWALVYVTSIFFFFLFISIPVIAYII
jgi:hypothetical protein